MARQYHESARRNNAGSAKLYDGQLERPFAGGNFRYVGRGYYTSGKRKGQDCVIKWFRGVRVSSSTYYKYDIGAVNKALDIVKKFNNTGIIRQHIRLNIPEVWEVGESYGYPAGTKVLIEPYIESFRKWNSNTGWNSRSTAWGQVMQALSHFSYHISGRQLVICDLQGGVKSNGAVLTDPAICSRTNSYGLTDLGKDGIYNFFAHHKCYEFCRDHWDKPRTTKKVWKPRQSTSMVNTQSS